MVATRLTPCKWTQRGHEEWRGWQCMIIRSQSVITKAAVARGLHGVVIVSLRNLFIHLPLFIIFACLYKLRKVTPLRSNPLKRLVRLRSVFGLLSPYKWVQFFSSSFSQGEIIRKASIFLLLLLDRSLIKFWFHFKINILIISKEYSFNEIVKIFGDKKLTMRSSYLSNLPSSFYFRFFNERRRVINWSFFFFYNVVWKYGILPSTLENRSVQRNEGKWSQFARLANATRLNQPDSDKDFFFNGFKDAR